MSPPTSTIRASSPSAVWFHGTVAGGELVAGDDADEVGWFPLDDLPPLAFPTDAALFDRIRRGEI